METDQINTFSADELRMEIVNRYPEGTRARDEMIAFDTAKINMWLDRGDKVVVYVNQDLGHPDLGNTFIASYGSPDAQFEVESAEDLPYRFPDSLAPSGIGWRYIIAGVYEGGPL